MGNASGGWSLPQLEVPLARYTGRSSPAAANAGERANAVCGFTGAKLPFDARRLKSLYRDRAEYLRRFRAAVDRAVAERRLVREDGEALKSPRAAPPPAF